MSSTWKRSVRFIAEEDSKIHVGEPIDQEIDIGLVSFNATEVIKVNELSGTSLLDLDASFTGRVLTIKQILSPVSEEETWPIRCIGLNVSSICFFFGSYNFFSVDSLRQILTIPLLLFYSVQETCY